MDTGEASFRKEESDSGFLDSLIDPIDGFPKCAISDN